MSDTPTAPTETAPRPLTLDELDALDVGEGVFLTDPIDGRHELAIKCGSKRSGHGKSIWRMTSGSTYPGSEALLRYSPILLRPTNPPDDLV